MKLVISDKKTGKAYNKKTEAPVFLNRKVGEEVDLGSVGMPGFKAKITGGSDNQGFPMKPTLEGQARKKVLLQKGTGIRAKKKGIFLRKNVRGNSVSQEIVQLNLAITHEGSSPITDFVDVTVKSGETKESAKERLVKQSLENVGNVAMAEEAKKIKGKAKG